MAFRKEADQDMDPKALIDKGRLRYSCRCGWIDTGRSDPKTVRPGIGPGYLWFQILNETGKKTLFSGAGFKVRYTQDAIIKLWKFKTFPGVTGEYLVSPRLNPRDKESVALAIFEEVSRLFEERQELAFWSGSDFSIEDLVSNLISFYSLVRPGPDYLKLCGVVSKQDSMNLLARYLMRSRLAIEIFYQSISIPTPVVVPVHFRRSFS